MSPTIYIVAVLLGAVPSICLAIKFWLWLRFCRHVVDRHGLEALGKLPQLARPFKFQLPWISEMPQTIAKMPDASMADATNERAPG
ncbi:hypothetical protein [Nonomuraea sp. NPDC049784]|uniref:hypothetical protein n=1 Tax=Nonomuraea sp. NPDC049784 TaxID=3154361 RepID=UPI0033EAD7DA